MTSLSNGGSFSLGALGTNSNGIAATEGTERPGPALHVWDISPFCRLGNAL